MTKRYVKKWRVQSNSDNNKFYTVSLTEDGKYECSCPAWIYRRKECSHIQFAKANPNSDIITQKDKPIVVYAKVRQVTKEGTKLLTPLVPLRPDAGHFIATICYDLMKYGVSWSWLKEKYSLSGYRKEDVIAYIEANGRCIETDESFNSKIWGFWKTEIIFEGKVRTEAV